MVTTAEIMLPVCASIASAVVAAVVSFLAARGLKEHEWRLSVARDRLADRRQLYGRFLSEGDRIFSTGIASGSPLTMDSVAPLVSLNSEISLIAREDVRSGAEAICNCTLSLLMSKDRQGESSDDFFAAKSSFLNAARAELSILEGQASRLRG